MDQTSINREFVKHHFEAGMRAYIIREPDGEFETEIADPTPGPRSTEPKIKERIGKGRLS